MCLGIDASNLRAGGGLTHLVELLRASSPPAHGFSQVVVWGGKETLKHIEDHPWLFKNHQPLLDHALPFRIFWQRFKLSRLARAAGCSVLLVPGGSYAGAFRPIVVMSRNMLPFEWRELRRYGWSWVTLKLLILRFVQARTFRRASGLIFLTQYARSMVMHVIKTTDGDIAMIPHGVNELFIHPPREQVPINRYSVTRPFRVVYVSIIDVYKHQWHVAKAVAKLRREGFPVVLDLVGPAYASALNWLKKTMNRIDPAGEFVQYSGPALYDKLHLKYAQADLCLFASSCENMPNILLEGMASGLPIACSNRGPMPEVLGETGVYFDPENPEDIARALRKLIDSPELRTKTAKASFERAQSYSWKRCAQETFAFLSWVTRNRIN